MQTLARALTVVLILSLAQKAYANTADIGIEGFRDVYKEPDATVDDRSNYGSVTAGYTWTMQDYFLGIDGRYSQGTDHYKSDSGSSDGAPQYETDTRLRLGANLNSQGFILSPYIGAGWRWFFDNGKGRYDYSNGMISAFEYDRRINQFYVPVGADYSYSISDWQFVWNAEFDPMFSGVVKSRLAEGGTGESNISNHQTAGAGARGSLMIGHAAGPFVIEAGPFIRYWEVKQSEFTDINPNTGVGYVEPKNDRTQYGLALKILY